MRLLPLGTASHTPSTTLDTTPHTTPSIEDGYILCGIKSKVHTALYSEVIFRGLEYSRINY